MPKNWIVVPRPNRAAAVRLVCVPHAGGGVPTFMGWADRLPNAEVVVAQLPGRGARVGEPMVYSVPDAAGGLAQTLAQSGAYPTVFFGHGVGALVAFETARLLRDRHWPLVALFVSGRRAPALPDPLAPIAQLPQDEFIAEIVRRYDAIPESVMADPDTMRLVVPALRADFAMAERYSYEPAAPLPCPIVACGGLGDPHAPREELEAWRRETRGRFSVHMFGGGHFYIRRERESLTALVGNHLSVMVGALARCSGM